MIATKSEVTPEQQMLRLALCLLLFAVALPFCLLPTSVHIRGLATLAMFMAGMTTMWQIAQLAKTASDNQPSKGRDKS